MFLCDEVIPVIRMLLLNTGPKMPRKWQWTIQHWSTGNIVASQSFVIKTRVWTCLALNVCTSFRAYMNGVIYFPVHKWTITKNLSGILVWKGSNCCESRIYNLGCRFLIYIVAFMRVFTVSLFFMCKNKMRLFLSNDGCVPFSIAFSTLPSPLSTYIQSGLPPRW